MAADRAPVFICGALRSGTTLLRLMLDAHPLLTNPGEMDFLVDFPEVDDLVLAGEQYRAILRRSRIFNKYDLKVDPSLSCTALARSFVAQCDRPGQRLTINIHRRFDRALDLFPDAAFIHLLRDPRDVASSSIGMGWAGNVYFGVDHWVASEKTMDTVINRAQPGQLLTVYNEALVRDPQEQLGRICRFLGVDYDPAMLRYPEYSTYDAPDPTLVEQWRTKLSPREIALVESKAAPLMRARGYEQAAPPRKAPGFIEEFVLAQHNRVGRLAQEVRRYGAVNVVLDILARRLLPFQQLKDYVAGRRNVRAVKYLK